MAFIETTKRHIFTFTLGVLPLLIALAIYLYMDFSNEVKGIFSDNGISLFSFVAIFGIIGLIGFFLGPKIDSYRAQKSSSSR